MDHEQLLAMVLDRLSEKGFGNLDDEAKQLIAERSVELFEISSDVLNGRFNSVTAKAALRNTKSQVSGKIINEKIVAYCGQKNVSRQSMSAYVGAAFKRLWHLMELHAKTEKAFRHHRYKQANTVSGKWEEGRTRDSRGVKHIITQTEKGEKRFKQ